MKKIAVVIGTRPEAVKMCPLLLELKNRKNINTVLCVTGQHREMLDGVLERFGVVPDVDLDIMKDSQTLFDITERTMSGFRDFLFRQSPDVVVVHGDTTTAFAAALSAFYMKIPVAHVEAGLRTHDAFCPYPEEFNRTAIDAVCKYMFAPTEKARENLINEGRNKDDVYVVGNTAIDALKYTIKRDYSSEILQKAGERKLLVLTAHRRENRDDPKKFRAMLSSVAKAAHDAGAYVIFPVHKSPAVRNVANDVFGKYDNAMLCEPLDVFDFHNICSRAYLCVTDSGGIQEETPSMSLPVLVLRDETERPEAVECGAVKLCGTNSERIYGEVYRLLTDDAAHDAMTGKKNPFGDGFSSVRIADILTK